MYRRNDPRIRRTLNQLSHNLESANESAQVNLFTFSQHYINPCLSSIRGCFQPCGEACFPSRDDRLRRHRGRPRGRAEASFDFYDDWEEDENDRLLGWGNDELDRLIGGSGGYNTIEQPRKQRVMSYGSRRERDGRFPNGRRRSTHQPHDVGPDPTLIPTSSYFGFLTKWIGGKGVRYKPSAADLQEHPGVLRQEGFESEPLMEDTDEGEDVRISHRRTRTLTSGSHHTTDSLSSRGDLFPSEDEDDAVPLDDEFAMVLERRTTGSGHDESGSGRSKSKRKPGSRNSTRTASTRSMQSPAREGEGATNTMGLVEDVEGGVPSLSELKREEDMAHKEEEEVIGRRRAAARVLAAKRGLSSEPPSVSDHF